MDAEYTVTVRSDNTLSVEFICQDRKKQYQTSLGYPGKHGLQGYCDASFLCFEGGKVLFQPQEFYMDRSVRLNAVTVRVIKDRTVTVFSMGPCDWFSLYDLRKRCFAFAWGEWETERLSDGFWAYFPPALSGRKLEICRKIQDLIQYYEARFGALRQEQYEIYLLPAVHGQKVFAGAGQTSQGATLDPDCPRDWELLSHRLFHAFFDSNIQQLDMLLPPYLWIYEGLAVYHEIESVQELGIHGNWEKLRKRYQYGRRKYGSKLELDPWKERDYLQCGYQIEFLHYTQAPLILRRNHPGEILKQLRLNTPLKEMGEQLAICLENDWSGIEDLSGQEEDLHYFDYILKTWGIGEDAEGASE